IMRFDSFVIWILLIWVLLVRRERKFTVAGTPQRSKLRLLIAAIAIWFAFAFGLAAITLLSFGSPDEDTSALSFIYSVLTIAALLASALVIWWLAMRRKGETNRS
ncbi:MAG: hypothetical protein Q8L53_14765, partial [Aestuariivirga sp.]|nr:hypothetical protein [Aestuariivirga sp.]